MKTEIQRAKQREHARLYRERHPERVRLSQAKCAAKKDQEAAKAYQAAYYQRNREKILARVASKYTPRPRRKPTEEERAKVKAAQLERAREAHYRNHEHRLQQKREWASCNRGKGASYAAKRRAMQRRATPAWANEFYVSQAYELARLRSEMTGFEWEVDHIVPLAGALVCGLHVENNLQVVPMKLNRSKSNRLWPDMPA